ncbi:hypothetical protein K438DRAFT_1827417 [Mycena galopus ATCC 62051]|nr:hypothetical protein K438DRAFT_1827417 [Mycena galopus ATCC 62051]
MATLPAMSSPAPRLRRPKSKPCSSGFKSSRTSASQARTTPSILDESIDRTRNASKVQMQVIQRELGYDKKRWNSFRSYCHDAVTSARLNWDGNWKSQRSEKLSMAYNAIEASFPDTRRFEGQWTIDRTVKQCWDNRKNYRNCVNPTTFCGKEARRGESPSTTPHTSPSPPRSPTAPRSSGSPTPGPSRPHARPINRHRIDPDDDSNGDEDGFVDASDPECTLDHGDGYGGKSAKGKGKHKATTQGGKNPKQARRDNQ